MADYSTKDFANRSSYTTASKNSKTRAQSTRKNLQQRLTELQQQKLDYLQYSFQPINLHGVEHSIELGQTLQNRPYRIELQNLTKPLR
jgi:hypothetical protein